MESVDDIVGKAVWGGDKVEWAYREAVGRAGGIISLWDSDEFACSSSWNMEGAVIVNGFWKEDGTRCCVVNVYAPCQVTAKMEFWDRILSIIDQEADSRICILGDFNSIRNDSKREGRRAGSCRRDVMAFDSFIRDSGLVDLPLRGRTFTWYRPDGTCKSRLDRILINNKWVEKWPDSYQKGLRRSISDHCPIILENKGKFWGPKPFRVVNAWFTHPDFRSFVENKWNEYRIEGWGGFILKEKFKKLKEDLKEWNRSIFGNMEEKIEKHREEIWKLDALDDTLGLEEHEIIQRNHESALILSELQRKDSLLLQRARCNWLKNGDTNSRFFHCYINRRRKRNEILGLKVNNIWTEDVQEGQEREEGCINHMGMHCMANMEVEKC
ncbi:hypothetical protein ACS0TY_033457 [Phlomoides rotata]